MAQVLHARDETFRWHDALLRHRWSIVLATAIAGLLALIVSLLITPVYEATSTLRLVESKLLEEHRANSLPSLGGVRALVQTNAIAAEAIATFNLGALEDLTRAEFLTRITTEQVTGSSLVRIRVRMSDAQRATDVANWLARRAIAINGELNQREERETRDFIGQQRADALAKLRTAERALLEFKQRAQLDLVKKDVESTLKIREELLPLRITVEAERAKLATAEAALANSSRLVTIHRVLRGGAGEQRLVDQELNPAYLEIEKEMALTRTKLRGLEQELSQAVKTYGIATSSDERLQRMYRDEITLKSLEAEHELLQKIYSELASRHEVARIQVASKSAELQLVDPAPRPDTPIAPRKTLNVVVGAVCGFVFALMVTVLRESARLPIGMPVIFAGAVVLGSWAAWDALAAAVAALVLFMAVPLLQRLAARQSIDPLEALWPFLACYGVTFALKPFLLMEGILTYPWTNIDRPSAVVGVLWAIAALAFVHLGYLGWRPGRAADWLHNVCADQSIAGIRVGAALVSIGGVAAIAAIAVLGGIPPTPETVFSERFRTVAFEVVYGRGYLTLLVSLSVYGPAAQCYVALSTRRWFDRSLCGLWFVLVTGAVLCFYSRALLLQVFILLLVVLHFKGGWFRARSLAVMGLALLILGGALGLRRIQNDNSPISGLAAPLAAVAFLGSTFDSFEFLVPAVQKLSFFGELSGQSLVEDVVWTFVPRALFPNKPDTYGAILVQNALMSDLETEGAQLGTFPAGFLVEWYVNFGICGFLFIAFAYGAVLRVATAVVMDREPRLIPLLVYGGIVLNVVGLYRSSSQTLIQGVLYTVLLLLIFARWPGMGMPFLRRDSRMRARVTPPPLVS